MPCLVVVVVAGAAVAQCRTNCTVNKVKIGLDTPRPTRRPLGPNYELRLTSSSLDSPPPPNNQTELSCTVLASWRQLTGHTLTDQAQQYLEQDIWQDPETIFDICSTNKVPNNKLALMNLIHFDLLLAITKSTFVVRARGQGVATNIPHMTVVIRHE